MVYEFSKAQHNPTLHRCHILYVPFENLSVYGKEKIELSKEWLFEKIVRRHRGGFCFELNKMFSFLLNYLGFEYTTLAASVFRRKTGVQSPPLPHLVLMVKVGCRVRRFLLVASSFHWLITRTSRTTEWHLSNSKEWKRPYL